MEKIKKKWRPIFSRCAIRDVAPSRKRGTARSLNQDINRILTGFIVIIHGDRCWFGFLHHGRLVNFERERHLVNLKKIIIEKNIQFKIIVCLE